MQGVQKVPSCGLGCFVSNLPGDLGGGGTFVLVSFSPWGETVGCFYPPFVLKSSHRADPNGRRPRSLTNLNSSQGSRWRGGDKSSGASKVFTLQSRRTVRPACNYEGKAVHNWGGEEGNWLLREGHGLCWRPQGRFKAKERWVHPEMSLKLKYAH